jgi:hypothetical protein
MSNSSGSSILGGIIDYGIDLKLESLEEEFYYISEMCDYFNTKTEFRAYLSGEGSLEVEFDKDNVITEVLVKNSTLLMLPYSDDFFEVFTLVLSFIAKEHQRIIEELRPSELHKIQDPKEIGKAKNVKNQEEPEEESSSDDDYEWI